MPECMGKILKRGPEEDGRMEDAVDKDARYLLINRSKKLSGEIY